MRRDLGDGYELDDDSARVDREAVHAYVGGVSYWAKGRSREVQDALIDGAARVVGLYHDGTTRSRHHGGVRTGPPHLQQAGVLGRQCPRLGI